MSGLGKLCLDFGGLGFGTPNIPFSAWDSYAEGFEGWGAGVPNPKHTFPGLGKLC